jgi:hypothetical protein
MPMKSKTRHVVALSETDATSAMYYSVYLELFDRARVDLYRDASLPISLFYNMRAKAAYVEFSRVVKFLDELEILSWFCRLGTTSVKMCHQVLTGGEEAARGYVVDVYVVDGKPTRIPDDIRAKISSALDTPDFTAK